MMQRRIVFLTLIMVIFISIALARYYEAGDSYNKDEGREEFLRRLLNALDGQASLNRRHFIL